MANALITTLGSSGDFNVDITKYRAFPATIRMTNDASYTTIFSDVPWTWAKVIANQVSINMNPTASFPGAPQIILPSNTTFVLATYFNPYGGTAATYRSARLTVSATSTSLAIKSGDSSMPDIYNLLVMVPED